jgi:hypothetical protein
LEPAQSGTLVSSWHGCTLFSSTKRLNAPWGIRTRVPTLTYSSRHCLIRLRTCPSDKPTRWANCLGDSKRSSVKIYHPASLEPYLVPFNSIMAPNARTIYGSDKFW